MKQLDLITITLKPAQWRRVMKIIGEYPSTDAKFHTDGKLLMDISRQYHAPAVYARAMKAGGCGR